MAESAFNIDDLSQEEVKALKPMTLHSGSTFLSTKFFRVLLPFFIGLPLVLVIVGSAAGAGVLLRVSTESAGAEGNGSSHSPSLSADGRYEAFVSNASNLVSGDTNGRSDIFIKDTQTGQITRVSTDSAGAEGNGGCGDPSLSPDARYLAFYSASSNLVPGDSNGYEDIFLKDIQTGSITRVSTDSAGAEGNQSSHDPSLSPDGRYVAFFSSASNLVPGDGNGEPDVFLKDTATVAITRVSTDSYGAEGNGRSYDPSLSADGRYVAFFSYASNLVSGDSNIRYDVYLKDVQTGATTRVSTDSAGAEGNSESLFPSISADGRYVAFDSASSLVPGDNNGLFDVYLKHTLTGATFHVSTDFAGTGVSHESRSPSLSPDGRYVAFHSAASDLVTGENNVWEDVYVKDVQTGAITRVSTDSAGAEANGGSYEPSLSADGTYVAFSSYASNLVPSDSNGEMDIFLSTTASGDSDEINPSPTGTPAAEATVYVAELTELPATGFNLTLVAVGSIAIGLGMMLFWKGHS